MATYQVLGTYKIVVTRQTLTDASKHYDWENDWLDQSGILKDEIWNWYIAERRDEMNTIALIEANILGDYSETELSQFSHGPSDQAPYLEFYLDETGTKTLPYKEAVSLESRRICFFLHFFDYHQPINVKQGKKIVEKISLPAPTEMPERLKPLCYYIPYD